MSLFLFMDNSLFPVKIILASQSPRRQQLLRQIGIDFEARKTRVDEVLDHRKGPIENVLALSQQKAFDVSETVERGIIAGFDTVVALGDTILGKPRDAADAQSMLHSLSGREHLVYTGFTIVEQPRGRVVSDYEKTAVTFRRLAEQEIERYVASGSPLDKAGAYGIQDDMGAIFIERIDGCFYNVMGLPLTKFYVTLKSFLTNSHG